MFRTETHSPHAFQEEPLTFQPERHYSRGNGVQWTGSVHTPLGSHPIKSTVSWVLACQVHWPLRCCVQTNLKLKCPPLCNSQDVARDEQWLDKLWECSEGQPRELPWSSQYAQDVGRQELKEGPDTYPFLLSIFLFS